MNKEIYKDDNGLYFVEYDFSGNPKKIYCDENGEKELFQDAKGPYYVEYDEKGLPAKAYCDENGNRLASVAPAAEVELAREQVAREEGTQDGLEIPVTRTEAVNEQAVREAAPEPVAMDVNNTSYTGINGTNEGFGGATAAAMASANVLSEENPKKKKSKVLVWLGTAAALLAVSAGGYFAYSKFLAKPTIKLENYQISFAAKGSNGQGTPEVKVDGIPVAENTGTKSQEEIAAIDKILVEPTISYSKSTGLSNGDQVEVTLGIDPAKAKEQKLDVKGEFKQSFTVSGLSEASTSSTSSSSFDKKEESSSSNKSDEKSSNSKDEKKESTSNEPNKNWFAINGQHRADNGDHPDTQLKNGFNSWASGKGLSLERMKGGSEFGGTILGNKIDYKGKQIDLRFIRYHGETQETIKAGEILKDTYNVVGIFSDKSSVIYVLTIYNGKAQVFKSELSGGKPKTKDGLIVFEDAEDSAVKDMLQGVIDRMK